MRLLAHEKRAEYCFGTSDIRLSSVRGIYKKEGIRIDPCPGKLRKLKAAYFNDDDGCSILLNMNLPEEPRLFAMVHELKHHYTDHDRLACFCHDVTDSSPVIEIGAEVFSAEFIFPEGEFAEFVRGLEIARPVTAEQVVRIKYHSPVPVSYQFIQKRLEWLGLVMPNQFRNVQFRKLHAQLFGSPHYRRPLHGNRT
jgi:Zn-dependent peptidase ImmA (M78 family)